MNLRLPDTSRISLRKKLESESPGIVRFIQMVVSPIGNPSRKNMEYRKILVTGGDGMIGRVVVQELRSRGYQVTSTDKFPAHKWDTKFVDCEDFGQVISVMREHDAVIHLAAIPNPNFHPAEVVFRNNVVSTYNILEAATVLGIKKVVLASSIAALGTVNMVQHINPQRIPIDEDHPLLSQDAYGLSKMVGEELADGFHRRNPEMSLSSLRFTMTIDDDVRVRFIKRYRVPGNQSNVLRGVFWTYVDVRDAAASCRLALEYKPPGHEAFYIAAPTILLDVPVEELLAQHYPGDYPVAKHIRGTTSPIDCSKAEHLLGWKAQYDWDGNPL
jgi:nucleoside-diphosphate-sugar epimerase